MTDFNHSSKFYYSCYTVAVWKPAGPHISATNLERYSEYGNTVRLIGITSLEERRVRGDMSEVYKLLAGREKIDYKKLFNSTNAP